MSDVLILGLTTIFSAAVITPVVAWLIRRSEKRVVDKVDTYHKEINGRVSELLQTTKALGKAEGKAQEIADSKQRNK